MDGRSNIPARRDGRRVAIGVLNVVLAAAGLAAVAALVLEYGFRRPPVSLSLLRTAETVIVGVFVFDRLARLLLARSRGDYLRENWLDFLLIALAGVAVALSFWLYGGYHGVMSAGTFYVVITQAYLFLTVVLRGVGLNVHFAERGWHPTWLLAGSFVFLCLAGSGLLMLPTASPEGATVYYVDALFTSTSASCVTGLIVRDTGRDWTMFGQVVILTLIQLGGLGIMLFGTMVLMLMGRGLSFRTAQTLDEAITGGGIGRIGRTVSFVILTTFLLEAVGAVLLYPAFSAPRGGRVPTPATAIWDSVFHSVSSFCNAGFSLYSRNMAAGVKEGWAVPLREHWQIIGVMAPLIVLGGLGFPVLQETTRWGWEHVRRWWRRVRRRPEGRFTDQLRPRMALHSRLVLLTSGAAIVVGAVVLPAVEPWGPETPHVGRHETVNRQVRREEAAARDWRNLPPAKRVRAAVFQSITARTAGFNTIDMDELSNAGKMWMCGLMVVGGSPASTAGGMKTTTFALLVLAAWCMIRRRGEIEAFGRSVAAPLFRRAVTLGLLYFALVATVTLLLSVVLRGEAFIDVLFEACSACGTVGLSTGVTNRLNVPGKSVIIAAMFIGRVGPLTLLVALTSGLRPLRYNYPTEDVLLG